MNRAISIAILLAAPGIVIGASFDCAKASRKVEKMICADAELSRADEQLNKYYEVAREKVKENGEEGLTVLKEFQKKWISRRDECVNADCVLEMYSMQLSDIFHAVQVSDNSYRIFQTMDNNRWRQVVLRSYGIRKGVSLSVASKQLALHGWTSVNPEVAKQLYETSVCGIGQSNTCFAFFQRGEEVTSLENYRPLGEWLVERFGEWP